jgi:hypothetical protein
MMMNKSGLIGLIEIIVVVVVLDCCLLATRFGDRRQRRPGSS